MKRKTLRFGKGFRVTFGNRRCQAAGDGHRARRRRGGSKNRHRGADQWLFVVAGHGVALIKGVRYPLKNGTLLLIEHADQHEIRNTGRSLLKTLNVYSPPAYTRSGEELQAVRP